MINLLINIPIYFIGTKKSLYERSEEFYDEVL